MLEAVQRSFERDEKGRFAQKAADDAAAAATAAAAPAAAPAAQAAKPEEPAAADDDITKMPEGLGQKAQQRFQALANGLKEARTELEGAKQQVAYVQQQFQQHGVSQPQFEQAVAVIGMLNKGDYRSALRVLDEQRRQIALAIGEPLPGVDALSEFPDLRQRVDDLQMTEADAMEVAKLRRQQAMQQQHAQAQKQAWQSQQAEQQAFDAGMRAVDQWAKTTAATDLDYPRIEKLLMPRLQQMLQGVDPRHWVSVVRAQYETIKEAAGQFRSPATATPDPLRPAGAGATQRAPTSMHEAMWGRSA